MQIMSFLSIRVNSYSFDVVLCYNDSSMSRKKMAINCSHCCKQLVRSTTQKCASEQNHDDGLATLIPDEMSYYHLNGYNSPLAIITWGVLGFFKMVGVGLRAVWRTDILYIVKWLFQLVLMFLSKRKIPKKRRKRKIKQ